MILYEYSNWFSKKYNTDRYNLKTKDLSNLKGLTSKDFNECLLRFMYSRLSENTTNHTKEAASKMVYSLTRHYDVKGVTELELEQDGIASLRAERVQKRIDALKKKLKKA